MVNVVFYQPTRCFGVNTGGVGRRPWTEHQPQLQTKTWSLEQRTNLAALFTQLFAAFWAVDSHFRRLLHFMQATGVAQSDAISDQSLMQTVGYANSTWVLTRWPWQHEFGGSFCWFLMFNFNFCATCVSTGAGETTININSYIFDRNKLLLNSTNMFHKPMATTGQEM